MASREQVFLVACYLLALSAVEGSLVATKASALEFAELEAHPVTATLIAEHASIQRDAQTRIGVLFDIEDGWHIYAQDPGDAGLPTRIEWRCAAVDAVDFAPDFPDIPCPDGVFGPVFWPAPEEFLDPGDIRTFGYTGKVLLFSTLQTPERCGVGLRVTADVRWLACKDVCIPGKADLELVLPLSPDPPAPSPHAYLFQVTADSP